MISVFQDAKHGRFVTQSGVGKYTKIHDTLEEALREVSDMFQPAHAEKDAEPLVYIETGKVEGDI